MFSRVLVGVDDSDGAEGAVALGRLLANRAGAELVVGGVLPELHPQSTVLDGEIAGALRKEAGKGIDLLCLGSRSHGPTLRVLLGSVSAAVIEDAPCPVLVVPRSGGEGSTSEPAAMSETVP